MYLFSLTYMVKAIDTLYQFIYLNRLNLYLIQLNF